MKKLFLLLTCTAFIAISFSQKNSRGITASFTHDMALVKPMININDSSGGYYSEYYYSSFNFMYCAAVVKNAGTDTATSLSLEIKFIDYGSAVIDSYNSDLIPSLAPGESYTLNIPGQLTLDWIYTTQAEWLVFTVSCDLDENPADNIDTVPFTQFSDWMWTNASRSVTTTNSYDATQGGSTDPGSFFGFSMTTKGGQHWPAYMMVYLPEVWPDSSMMMARIYQNGIKYDSAVFYLPIPPEPCWVYSDPLWFFYGWGIMPDSLYYIGVEITCPPGQSFMIGADTSSYHNFPVESIARIGTTWTSLNFVPVIRLVCDPEGINESNHAGNARVFPNPASENLTIENAGGSRIELYDLAGKLLLTDLRTESTRKLDISSFHAGIYLLRILGKEGIETRKIVIQ